MFEGTDQTYKEIDYFGGKCYYEEEYPDIIYAKFGEIYNINNKKVINLDGAYSVDKDIRLYYSSNGHRGWHWFESELPTDEMKQYAIDNLKKNKWKVDYVFSHTCPYSLIPIHMFMSGVNQSTVNQSMEYWLEDIHKKLKYNKWYFGHWHNSEDINKKVVLLYHQIIKLGDNVDDDYETKLEYGTDLYHV